MDWLSLVPYSLIGGLMGFLATRFFFWVKTPKPVDRHELPRLRAEAIRIIQASDTNEFSRDMEITLVTGSKDVEALRIFVKFGEHCKYANLAYIVTGMRVQRMKMKPSDLTLDHIKLANDIDTIENNIIMSDTASLTPRTALDLRTKSRRVMYFAFQNMDQSQSILSIMRDRGITDLPQIKELLSVMKKTNNTSLSEGML